MSSVFVANGAAIVLLCMLMSSFHRKLFHSAFDDKLFLTMVICTAGQSVSEALTFLLDGRSGPAVTVLLLLLNSYLYMNNIFFAFVWTAYADYKVFGDMKRIRRIYTKLMLPAVLIAVGAVVNFFTPVYYRITADNVYERCGIFWMPYLITYLYLAYGVALIYRNKEKSGKYLFLPAILFMIPILLGSILQYLFYGLSLTWLGAAIALVSLYINVQNEVSYTDPLSGLYTRLYMNQYLAAEVRRTAPGHLLGGIMLDIDRFKQINDSFGHLVGDEAIATAGRLLRASVKKDGIAVRFAGDEFVIIESIACEDELSETIRRIRANTERFNASGEKAYRLNFSIGCAIYSAETDTIDSFLNRMDANMYADKKDKIAKKLLQDRRS